LQKTTVVGEKLRTQNAS